MNRIFTLCILGMLCFAFNQATAQTVSENFNNGLPSTTNCWTTTDMKREKDLGTGGSDAASTKGSSTATLMTPFIDLMPNGTIEFDYKASNNSIGYNLTVSIVSNSGAPIQLSSLPITNSSGYLHYISPALPAGTYRVLLNYSSTAGSSGNSYILIDNLSISGSFHYSSFCNGSPTAVNDSYTATSFASPTVTGNILTNDTDPNITTNGEVLSVVSNTSVTSGTLTVNANGTFSFTPNASFTGGPVTFTYTVSDNGYSSLSSNTATVTIIYPIPPVAVNDGFGGPLSGAAFTSNVITNDNAPIGKTLIANLVQGPSSGQVVLQPNGSFTYTPPSGFTGGDVSFTYNVTYDTYMPLSSNAATVTINYPVLTSPLPIKLLSFTGHLSNNQALLHWSVDDNETGNYFKVEKSIDGKNFTEAALVFASSNKGQQEYSFKEPFSSGTGVYYRLQIVNNDAPPSYSKTVLIKPLLAAASASIDLAANPVQSMLRFTFTADLAEQTTVRIYTINGTKVLTHQLTTVKGINGIELETSTLPRGLYVLEVSSKTASRKTRFLK